MFTFVLIGKFAGICLVPVNFHIVMVLESIGFRMGLPSLYDGK